MKLDLERLIGSPRSVKLKKVVRENETVRTLLFEDPTGGCSIAPGQFLMIWIPGLDEIPMSISHWEPPILGFTVAPVGGSTVALSHKKKGDWIGVRGPFGQPFQTRNLDALVVGGGIGAAPLRPLVYKLVKQQIDVTLLLAGRTADDLIFVEEFEKLAGHGLTLELATDDGSAGFEGLADIVTEALCDRCRPEIIYTCGPELMMRKLTEIAHERDIEIQASLERFMKCGCGICGTCAMDSDGCLVCLDGPVFMGKKLRELTEFGEYHRDSTGARKEY